MKKTLQISMLFLIGLFSVAGFGCGDSSGNDSTADGDTPESESPDGDADRDAPNEAEPDGTEEADSEESPLTDPIFSQGCPVPGQSRALLLADPAEKMIGPDSVGVAGDALLMNEKAAFVIEAPEHTNAYYIYGGVPVDAVAVNGCRQATQDRFEEIGFMMGQLNAANFASSVLRAFKGESMEIVNDGTDGEAAVVRVTGTDDIFWIVEQTLLTSALEDGVMKGLSEPYALRIEIDYILEPGSQVLTIRIGLTNTKAEALTLLLGTEVMFGDTTPVRYYADSVVEFGGFGLEKGIPWYAASAGEGAWAVAIQEASMMGTNIGGLSALLDFHQAVAKPIKLKPAGEEGDSALMTFLLAVGETDGNSAARALAAVNPEPIPGMPYSLAPVSGTVKDEGGAPLAGALVVLQAQNSSDAWMPLDSFYTGADGAFAGEIPDFGAKTPSYRFQASLKGYAPSEPSAVDPDSPGPYDLTLAGRGSLNLVVKDEEGKEIPAKALIYAQGALATRLFHVPGDAPASLAPGAYTVSVSRGYEYSVYEGDLTVSPGAPTDLTVTLTHLLDTTGYLSVDTHCHAGPSPDNTISLPDRIRTVAGEGLEVVVSTDHEYVGSWASGIEETGLGAFVATVTGQEVTATLPNHTNIFPVEARYDLDARGGYVRWWGRDIAEIFAMERERGAAIIQFNHPRRGNYFTVIEYDPDTGETGLTDPAWLGFGEDAVLWDWDFNTVELMNGPQFIFVREERPGQDGTFNDWMSFLNLGHKVTAVGVSDAHDYEMPGRPRNFYLSATDDPAQFTETEMVDALLNGRSMVSTGGFARVTVNDTAGLGDLVTDTDGQADVSIRVEAIPEVDVAYIKVYVNCDQALVFAADSPADVLKFEGTKTVAIARDSTVVVAAFGVNAIPNGLGNYDPAGTPRVITNAIYVDFDGNGTFDPPGAKTCAYDLNGP